MASNAASWVPSRRSSASLFTEPTFFLRSLSVLILLSVVAWFAASYTAYSARPARAPGLPPRLLTLTRKLAERTDPGQRVSPPAAPLAPEVQSRSTPAPPKAAAEPAPAGGSRLDELLEAASYGDTATLLARATQVGVNRTNAAGLAALHMACAEGQLEAIRTLLDLHADLEAAADRLQRPLHLAAERGHLHAVQLLLARGAQLNAETAAGETPLALAAAQGHRDVVEALLERGADHARTGLQQLTALHRAAEKGHALVVRALLAHGAAADAPGYMDWTPLYLCVSPSTLCPGRLRLARAARAGHVEVARLLLADRRGASTLESASREGATPLYVACEYGRPAIARLLLEQGAATEVPMASGATPMVIAAQKGLREIVQALLEYGADVDAVGAQAMGALHLAALGKFSEIIRLLVEAGAPVDAQDALGNTALHYSVIGRLAGAIALLLQYGADPYLANAEGHSAAQLAEQHSMSHLFAGMERVRVSLAPIAADEGLVATAIYTNGQSSLLELAVRTQRLFKRRVASFVTQDGDKYYFDSALPPPATKVRDLAKNGALTLHVGLRPLSAPRRKRPGPG